MNDDLRIFRATTPAIRERAWAISPASERIRHEDAVRGRITLVIRSAITAIVLLMLLFGVPLALGTLAVALGMDPTAGVR